MIVPDSIISDSENGISFSLDALTGYYKSVVTSEYLPCSLRLIRNLKVGNNRPCYFLKEQDIKDNSFTVPLFPTGYKSFFKGHNLLFTNDYKREFVFLLFYFSSDFNHLTIYSFRSIKESTTHLPEELQNVLIKSLITKINQQPIYQLNN